MVIKALVFFFGACLAIFGTAVFVWAIIRAQEFICEVIGVDSHGLSGYALLVMMELVPMALVFGAFAS